MTSNYRPASTYFIRSNLSTLLGAILLIVGFQLLLRYYPERAYLYTALGAEIVIILLLVYRLLYWRTLQWTLTEEQFIYKRGVFATSTDYLELYRINDFGESQTILDRLFGIKNITIHSTDLSTPELNLEGLDKHIDLLTELRDKVEQSKRNRRIYENVNP